VASGVPPDVGGGISPPSPMLYLSFLLLSALLPPCRMHGSTASETPGDGNFPLSFAPDASILSELWMREVRVRDSVSPLGFALCLPPILVGHYGGVDCTILIDGRGTYTQF